MTSNSLPKCRHRGIEVRNGWWRCHSTLVVTPAGLVPAHACATLCPYVDHPDEPVGGAISIAATGGGGPERPELAFAEDPPIRVGPRRELLSIALCTAPRPARTVERTIDELRRAGFDETIHVFQEPGTEVARTAGVRVSTNRKRLGIWRNWKRAARTILARTETPFLLICEDDVAFAPCAAAALQYAMRALDKTDWGYASLYTPAHNLDAHRVRCGWQPVRLATTGWGSLAYCFTRQGLDALLGCEAVRRFRGDKDTDVVVSAALTELGRKLYFHVPSLADHTGGGISTLGHIVPVGGLAVGFSPEYRGYGFGKRSEVARQAHESPSKVRAGKKSSVNGRGFSLITTLYQERSEQRFAEYRECLERNLENPWIDEIHVFYDTTSDREDSRLASLIADRRIQIIPIGCRLTFMLACCYANRYMNGWRVVLANADVTFDESLGKLTRRALAKRLVCLSRWERTSEGEMMLNANADSQDAWVFLAPIPVTESDIPLGLPRCDGRIAHEAQKMGLTPINPARSVRMVHVHASAARHWTWNQLVDGPVRAVPATTLEAALRTRTNGRTHPARNSDPKR